MRFLLALVLVISTTFSSKGQIPAIELMGENDEIKIPFTYYYNFIIVEVRLKNLVPMRFILDTGAENSLIFDRLYVDLLGISYEREISIIGSDFTNDVTAYIARRVPLTFPYLGSTHSDMIVLKENHYHLEQFLGIDVHGILGSNIFNGLVLSVDYEREYVKISRPDRFVPPTKAVELPIVLHHGKPYFTALTKFGGQEPDSLTYLMDTGAGVSAMFHNNTHESIKIPEKVISGNLGSGVGGFIKGYIGRLETFWIGPYSFNHVISSFQELDSTLLAQAAIHRNGIVGNQLLSRFDLTIDYTRKKAYLRPNGNFKKEFNVDRSGIFLIASGAKLTQYYIQEVLQDSPAMEAGLQSGDKIIAYNGVHHSFFSLSWLSRRFQKNAGKNVTLTVRRDGKKMKFSFKLRDLI